MCARKYQRQPASPPSSFCTQRPQSASPIVASSPPAPHRRPIDVDTLLPPPMTLDVSVTHASQANARAMLRGSSGPIASFPTATRAPRHRRVGQPLQRAVPCLRRAALCFSQLVGQHLFVTALVSALCLDGLRTVVRQTVRPTPLRSAPRPNQQNLSTAAAVAPRSFRVRLDGPATARPARLWLALGRTGLRGIDCNRDRSRNRSLKPGSRSRLQRNVLSLKPTRSRAVARASRWGAWPRWRCTTSVRSSRARAASSARPRSATSGGRPLAHRCNAQRATSRRAARKRTFECSK